GLVSGEGLIYHVRDAVYKQVEIKEKGKPNRVETVTVDAGVDDKRLLVIETEMGRVFKAMNRDSNNPSDVIRQGWDSGFLATMGKTAGCRSTGVHISLICHITTADIVRHLMNEDANNGFANRFIWLAVRRSKLLPDGGDMEGEGFQQVWR